MKQVMIRLYVHTHDAGEPTTVDVSMQTSLKWERKFRRSAPVQLKPDTISLEYLYELAWLELGCPGGDKGFDEWCQCHDVWNYPPAAPSDSDSDDEDGDESEAAEQTVDPTQPGPGTGSSSSSRARRASRSGNGATNSSKTNG